MYVCMSLQSSKFMKSIFTLLYFSAVAGDPCRDLCDHDGPGMCTEGSYTKVNGVCYRYMFLGDSFIVYCYHSSRTQSVCPGNGRPVLPTDVSRLISSPVLTSPVTGTPQNHEARSVFRGSRDPIAQSASSLFVESIIIEPENQHSATVIQLHGINGNARSMIDLGRDSWIASLKGNVKFISVGSHLSEWFESLDLDPVAVAGLIAAGKEFVDRVSLDSTMNKLVSLIDRESLLVGHARVFLLGYSRGGMVALWTGLMGGRNIGGVGAINSAVPILNIGQVATPGVDIAHFHGLHDRIIPVELARLGRERAGAAGATGYNLIEGPGGHDVSSGTKIAVTEWLSGRVGV